MKRLILPLALAALGGCSSEGDELRTFVRDSEKGLPRRIEPLPAVKPFEPFAYEGFDLPDPEAARKEALRSARELCEDEIAEGRDISETSFLIVDEAGRQYGVVPLSGARAAPGR